MTMKGDFAKLDLLRVMVSKVGRSGKLHTAMKKNLAAEAVTQVKFGFRESRDPYGVPWKPLKFRKGKPLLDTGRMRNSFTSTVTPTGFRLGSNVSYAPHHQDGTGGRARAYTRYQAVTRGKFSSHRKAAKQKQGAVDVRALNFRVGGGAIPSRPMVPTAERGGLGAIWSQAFRKVAGLTFKKFLAR